MSRPASRTGTRRSHPAGTRRGDPLGWAAAVTALLSMIGWLLAWNAGGGSVDLPWAPALDLRLAFTLDGLGALYGLLATGIGTAVFAFGARYLPLHLAHEDRPSSQSHRFWPWMLAFMVSMAGLATAQDLVLLFVFFDLTAICSYFLIGFDSHQRASRRAALMALTVTGVSAVALGIAAVLLYAAYGTFSIPELLATAPAGTTTTVAAALVAVAGLAKSAQVPLHFWLPRAMAAPTPVSAYLHSAAMVAAGVLIIGRVHPLIARSPAVLDALVLAGLASIVVGGVLALAKRELKQVLAHSTISQYGYVVVLYGLGGTAGTGAAAFYVIAHAVAKSALFLTAGAVTEATGADRLDKLGGLARRLPGLAMASGAAAATLAALPLTIGFFKDELFFKAALEHGPVMTAAAIGAATLTFAYMGRFWAGLFLGPLRAEPGRLPRLMLAPIAALAAVAVVGGIVVGPFAGLASAAASVTAGQPVTVDPAYHLDARPENLMALASWAIGGLLLAVPGAWRPLARGLAALGDKAGPRRLYGLALSGLNVVSDAVHAREVRDLRNSIALVLVPGGLLVGLGFLATPTAGAYDAGPVTIADLPVIVILVLVAASALTVAGARTHLHMVLALSVAGFGLAAVYAFIGAPDVALVAVVVETVASLIFLAALARLPRSGLRPRDRTGPKPGSRRWRDPFVGVVAGTAAFATIWGFLSRPAAGPGDAAAQLALAPAAHGKAVVTVILADFRALDTAGEVTVLLIAMAGVATLLRRGRLW
jgi:multicomponent Na+:H+ antiporter subunit A